MTYMPNGILFSVKKKKEIPPPVTTWMKLEGIILSEVYRHKKTNTVWYHLYVESRPRKVKLIETENRMVTSSWVVKDMGRY